MTSPVERIRVDCPACGTVFEDWFRASINLDLGEDFDEEYVRKATTATCPKCGHVVELEALIVENGVWRWDRTDKFVAPLDFERMKNPPPAVLPASTSGWKPPPVTLRPKGAVVMPQELAELSDAELVALIVERTGKDPGSAREALTIIRDEIPPNTVF